MAGDVDLPSVSSIQPFEVTQERTAPKKTDAYQPELSDDQFDTPDVSAERRKALEDAISNEGVAKDESNKK